MLSLTNGTDGILCSALRNLLGKQAGRVTEKGFEERWRSQRLPAGKAQAPLERDRSETTWDGSSLCTEGQILASRHHVTHAHCRYRLRGLDCRLFPPFWSAPHSGQVSPLLLGHETGLIEGPGGAGRCLPKSLLFSAIYARFHGDF